MIVLIFISLFFLSLFLISFHRFLSLYPFYYNAQTTDVQYFRRYNIAVDAIVSDVQITRLETNKYEYDLGEHIACMMELENQGSAPKKLVVSAAIRQQGTSEFVSGLPLQSLNDIAGTASYNAVWDSAGFEQGYRTLRRLV